MAQPRLPKSQPQNAYPPLRGEFAGAVFCYLPSVSLTRAQRHIGSIGGGTPVLAQLFGARVAKNVNSYVNFTGTKALDFTNGLTILAVGSHTGSSGTQVMSLINRTDSSQVGGFDLATYNKWAAPNADRLYASFYKPAVGDTNFDSAWVDGVKDTTGNGSFVTVDDRRYVIAVTTATGPAAHATVDLNVAQSSGLDVNSATEFVVIWPRKFTEQQMARITNDPYSVFVPQRRPRSTDVASGTSNTTATAAAGVATVSGVGSSTAATAATAAAGTATVSAVGKSTAATTASAAAGAATVSAVGAAVSATTATAAAGAATVSGTAALTAATSGTAAGSATVSAAGSSTAATTATAAAGAATVSGAGSSTAATTATPAAGTSTVSGVGSTLSAGQTTAIPADGVATVSATASSIAATNAVPAAGTATVSATTSGGAAPATDTGGGGGIDPDEPRATDGYPRGGKRSRNREPDWLKPRNAEALEALQDAIEGEATAQAAARATEASEARREALAQAEAQRLLMQSQAQVAALLLEQMRTARQAQTEQIQQVSGVDARALADDEEAVTLLLML